MRSIISSQTFLYLVLIVLLVGWELHRARRERPKNGNLASVGKTQASEPIIKQMSNVVVGLLALVLLISLAVREVGANPMNLQVLVCMEKKEFYAPRCADQCFGGREFANMSINEAFKQGNKPSARCISEGYFIDRYDETLLVIYLDKWGIWKIFPWNPDGTWRD